MYKHKRGTKRIEVVGEQGTEENVGHMVEEIRRCWRRLHNENFCILYFFYVSLKKAK
jgi:hypothetical protein